MFDKYYDQATDRRCFFWVGIVISVAGAAALYFSAWGFGACFFALGILYVLAAIFLGHSGFEKLMRMCGFFSGFTVF